MCFTLCNIFNTPGLAVAASKVRTPVKNSETIGQTNLWLLWLFWELLFGPIFVRDFAPLKQRHGTYKANHGSNSDEVKT